MRLLILYRCETLKYFVILSMIKTLLADHNTLYYSLFCVEHVSASVRDWDRVISGFMRKLHIAVSDIPEPGQTN